MLTDAARRAFGSLIDDSSSSCDAYRLDAWPLGIKRARAGVEAPVPDAVARPRSIAELATLVRTAAANGVPVVPWGAGSSVTGAPIPGPGALVLDTRGLDRIVDIDTENGHATVEAGVIGGALEQALGGKGLTSWFSPQSLYRSTVGGWVATRATGQFSSRWGGIEDAVVALKVVLADGTIVQVGTPPRGAVGPDLINMFIGSEGAFGVIAEVTLRVYPVDALHGLESYALSSVATGLEVVRRMVVDGLRPALVRLYDADEARHLAVAQPPPAAVLLVGFAGPRTVADAEQSVAADLLASTGAVSLGAAPVDTWMASRFDFSRVERLLDEQGGYAETIEVAAGWSSIGSVYVEMKRALEGLADEVLCHFSHVYVDGISLYVILLGRARTDTEAVERLEQIWDVAMATALRCGAVISHHHGVGRARARHLPAQLGPAALLLERLKRAVDPEGVLHPGSLVPLGGFPGRSA